MSDIEVYSVLVSRIEFVDGTGSKVRPAVVVKFNDEVKKNFKINY